MTSAPAADAAPDESPTAGEVVTHDVAVVDASTCIGDVIDLLRRAAPECATHVVVLREGAVEGLVPIGRILASADHDRVGSLVDERSIVVRRTDTAERAAWWSVGAGADTAGVAVVDADDHPVGVVTPTTLLGVVLAEHEADLARLGGYARGSTIARAASTEPVSRRLWHRLPWLLVGLVAALASAVLVSAFERDLEANIALAFFLPGIVYMADAVGTQTETLILRGLSVGIPIRRVVGKEVVTGLVVGVVMAAAFVPVGLLLGQSGGVVGVVALSLLAACGTATGIAMLLPALLSRLGTDPAFGSGPLATVAQDLLSIAIYLGIATLLLGS